MDLQRLLELSGAVSFITPEQQALLEAAKSSGGDFKQLDAAAQKVWAAKGDAKKAALISLINSFKFKDKQEVHLAKAEAMTNPNKMDKFAADLMQIGHGNKVVK